MANDYSKLTKEELLKRIEKLESRKKYGLIWDEERTKEQFEKESENALPVLKEVKGKEIKTDPSKPVNILIEGDNYHALSVLNYTHQGKIDVIYIDPPYNTGKKKEFKYNDDWVEKEDSYRHSKWLSFMSKRLCLAKKLLKEEGVIFISIDDNEFAQLKVLCDEIFGEQNFVDCISWEKKSSAKGVPPQNMIVNVHEYILVYKNPRFSFIGEPRDIAGFSNPDDDPRGIWRNTNIKSTTKDRSLAFAITDPDTGNKYTDTWAYSEAELMRLIKEKYLIFPKKETGQVRKKEYYNEFKNANMPIKSSWGLFDNQKNTEMLKKLLPEVTFLNPKPLYLMVYLLQVSTKKDAIILDFMAGSGTTGHAVSLLNMEDGGHRKYILCTNNENNIATDVCYPRLKAVIRGHRDFSDITGLKGNLKYYRTSFVKRAISKDSLKVSITRECTEMLCLREGAFDEVKSTKDYRIFQHDDRIMGVYYSLERAELKSLKKDLDKIKGKKILYCFTLDPLGLDKKDFREWKGVSLEPIPQKILDIYEGIYEY